MKVYPSIPGARGQQFREIANAVVFGKLDGSCMLSQWNPKRRFYKHGRRNGLLDSSNPQLERVPKLFEERLWPLVDEENATDTQLACVAFDCGFHSMIDTLWCDVERAEELPATPDQARQALKAWLASTPAPDDDLYVAALEHALAGRFSEMGATIRTILSHIDAAP